MKKRPGKGRPKRDRGGSRKPPRPPSNPYAVVVWTPPLRRPRTRHEIVTAVCRRIEAGELVDEAAYAEGWSYLTIWEWTRADDALAKMYALAREHSAESLEIEAIRVARSPNPMPFSFNPRLLVDTLKWAAAKRRPKVYSERVELVRVQDPAALSDQELEDQEKKLRAQLRLVS